MCSSKNEVIGRALSGESWVVAEFIGTGWSLMDSQWFLDQRKSGENGHIFELRGSRKVSIHTNIRLGLQ